MYIHLCIYIYTYTHNLRITDIGCIHLTWHNNARMQHQQIRMYTCTHTHIYICIHLYIHTHIYNCVHRMHTSCMVELSAHVASDTYVYRYTHIYQYLYTYIHTRIHTRISTSIYIYIHTYTHIYIYIHKMHTTCVVK